MPKRIFANRLMILSYAMGFIFGQSLPAMSQSSEEVFEDQAFRLHNRLACEPPSREIWQNMSNLLSQGDGEAAAKLAINHPGFLNCTVKRWCLEQTNVDRRADKPLNDYCATVIGAVRDDKPFGSILYEDLIYVADPTRYSGTTALPAFSVSDNKHYEFIEKNVPDLAQVLVERKQSEVTGLTKTSGLLTTRAFGEAFLSAGTNRRAVRFSMINYLCNDLEQLSDVTRSDQMVGRDVERDPGGDAGLYNSKCKGCHAGQDFFRGAWAYYDFEGGRVKYLSSVASKYANNANFFTSGYATIDDRWENNWIRGENGKLGWPIDKVKGNGVASFGEMISKTAYFNTCMAKKVFQSVCHRDGTQKEDLNSILELTQEFRLSNQNLRHLFLKTALRCSVGG